jgi:hypothetical protein
MKPRHGRALVAATFMAVGSLVVTPGARADAILLGSTSAATGINGLLVDGTPYDVTFVHDTYANVYSASTPFF